MTAKHLLMTPPAAGGGAFAPDDLAGMQLWLDAADLSGTLSGGDSLTAWTDKSTNGYSLTAASTAPTFETAVVNSLPVVRFTSGGVRDTSFNLADSSTSDATVFAVFDWRSGTAAVFGCRGASATGWGTRINGNTTGITYFGGRTPNVTVAGLAAGFGVIMVRRTGLDSESTVGGATPATGTHSGYGVSSAGWHVGSHGVWDYGGIDVAETVAYDVALSNTDANSVANYLADKYALSWTDL